MSDKRNDIWSEDDIIQQQQRKREVASLRNKVYIFFLWLFLFIFWPTFLGTVEDLRWTDSFSLSITDPINSLLHERWEWWILNNIEELDERIIWLIDEIEVVKIQQEVIENLVDQEKQNTIINCLNFDICDDINEWLFQAMNFLRIFIVLWNLQWGKFGIDQQLILRNLYEFIVDNWRLWEITFIRFGNAGSVSSDLQLFKLPISITLSFEDNTKENLLAILDNIENKIFMSSRVMYVINSMNYNIHQYNQPQTISLELFAYYFVWWEDQDD